MTRIDEIKARLRYLPPAPWQRSHFVSSERTKHWPLAAIDDAMQREARTIREAGEVGTPGCNVIFTIDRLEVGLLDYLANSRGDIEYLIERVEALEKELHERQ